MFYNSMIKSRRKKKSQLDAKPLTYMGLSLTKRSVAGLQIYKQSCRSTHPGCTRHSINPDPGCTNPGVIFFFFKSVPYLRFRIVLFDRASEIQIINYVQDEKKKKAGDAELLI